MKKIIILISLIVLFISTITLQSNTSIYFINSTINYRFLDSLVLILLNVILFIFTIFLNKKIIYNKMMYVILFFILFAISITLINDSVPLGRNIWSTIVFISPMLYFYLLTQIIEDLKDVRIVIILIVFISFMHSSQAILSYITSTDISRLTTRIGGTGPLSSLLMLTSSLGLYLFLKEKNKLKQILYLTQYVIILTGLILTFSRFPIFISLITNLLLVKKFNGNKFIKRKTILISFIFFIFVVLITSAILVSSNFNIEYLFRFYESGDLQRISFLEDSFKLIEQNIIFGQGWGFFTLRGASTMRNLFYSIDPHSSIILIIVETGLLGLFIFLFFIKMIFSEVKPSKLDLNIKYALNLSMISFMIHSILSTQIFYSINVASFFWIIFALTYKMFFIQKKNKNIINEGVS